MRAIAGAASHGSAVVLALLAAAAFAAPDSRAAGMPLQSITGAPVTPPSTDAHFLGGIWTSASGTMGTQDLGESPDGHAPLPVSWDNPLPLRPATDMLANVLTALAAQGISYATPHLTCRPNGIAGITAPKFPITIVQSRRELLFLMEEDRDVYHVRFDRSHPAHPEPTYNGDSVAHWEGATLVIDTIGYTDYGMLDENWHPVSAKAHLVQRFTKSADGKTLDIDTVLDDPVYYTKPLHMHDRWLWSAGLRQLENDCAQSPPDTSVRFLYVNARLKPLCTASWDAKTSTNKITCPNPAAKPSTDQ